jgi:hypothetical protein
MTDFLGALSFLLLFFTKENRAWLQDRLPLLTYKFEQLMSELTEQFCSDVFFWRHLEKISDSSVSLPSSTGVEEFFTDELSSFVIDSPKIRTK